MVIATSYPFLNILWSTLIFFAWVIFIWIAITVLIDVFRRHDISGWVKALWTILVVILPWLGVLVYLILYHDGMAERRMRDAADSQKQFDDPPSGFQYSVGIRTDKHPLFCRGGTGRHRTRISCNLYETYPTGSQR